MIDEKKRASKREAKERVRRRMQVQVDPENYEYIPAKKTADYYDNETPQRVAIYVRVSTDDIRQTTSYELQKKYYEDFVNNHPNWELVNIYADEGITIEDCSRPVSSGSTMCDAIYCFLMTVVIAATIVVGAF